MRERGEREERGREGGREKLSYHVPGESPSLALRLAHGVEGTGRQVTGMLLIKVITVTIYGAPIMSPRLYVSSPISVHLREAPHAIAGNLLLPPNQEAGRLLLLESPQEPGAVLGSDHRNLFEFSH